jgi:hypothetical protein
VCHHQQTAAWAWAWNQLQAQILISDEAEPDPLQQPNRHQADLQLGKGFAEADPLSSTKGEQCQTLVSCKMTLGPELLQIVDILWIGRL